MSKTKPVTTTPPPVFTARPIRYRHPSELSIHSAIKDMASLEASDPRYETMKMTWRETGIIPPVFATPEGRIADGRHRFWYCKDNGIDVPVVEITEDEVPLVILSAITGRNHTSKSQRAYFAAPYLDGAFSAAQERRLEILRSGGKATASAIPTVDELAKQLGVSRETLNQARRLNELFSANPALRKEWEPKILAEDDPISLGACLAGIAGQDKSKGETPVRNSKHHLMVSAVQNFGTQFKAWGKLKEKHRAEVTRHLTVALGSMPEPALALFATQATQALHEARRRTALDCGADPKDPAAKVRCPACTVEFKYPKFLTHDCQGPKANQTPGEHPDPSIESTESIPSSQLAETDDVGPNGECLYRCSGCGLEQMPKEEAETHRCDEELRKCPDCGLLFTEFRMGAHQCAHSLAPLEAAMAAGKSAN